MNKTKILTITIMVILLFSNIFFVIKSLQFPIKEMICNIGYTDCFVSARFKDVADCQVAVEMGSWYCDSTNPDDIQCRAAKPNEASAKAYCTK
jgi:hypothetical protein